MILIKFSKQPEFLIPIFALHLLGAIPTPCNPWVKPSEFANQLRLANARKVITTPKDISNVRSALSKAGFEDGIENVILIHGSAYGVDGLDGLSGDAESAFDPEEWNKGNHAAFICWSSGTSGPPKAVPLTHVNIIANILQFQALLGDRFNESPSRTSEIHIDILPQFHAYGLITTLLAFRTETPRYLMEAFDVHQFVEIVERDRVTFSMLVPPASKLIFSSTPKCRGVLISIL